MIVDCPPLIEVNPHVCRSLCLGEELGTARCLFCLRDVPHAEWLELSRAGRDRYLICPACATRLCDDEHISWMQWGEAGPIRAG